MFQSTGYLPNRKRGCQAMSLRKVQRWHPNGCISRLQGWFYLHLNKKFSRSDESCMICASWAGPSPLHLCSAAAQPPPPCCCCQSAHPAAPSSASGSWAMPSTLSPHPVFWSLESWVENPSILLLLACSGGAQVSGQESSGGTAAVRVLISCVGLCPGSGFAGKG